MRQTTETFHCLREFGITHARLLSRPLSYYVSLGVSLSHSDSSHQRVQPIDHITAQLTTSRPRHAITPSLIITCFTSALKFIYPQANTRCTQGGIHSFIHSFICSEWPQCFCTFKTVFSSFFLLLCLTSILPHASSYLDRSNDLFPPISFYMPPVISFSCS